MYFIVDSFTGWMDSTSCCLPGIKVMPRLLSCYCKQELVWSSRQRWGGVLVKTVLVIRNNAHIPQVPTLVYTLLGVKAWEGLFTQIFSLSWVYVPSSMWGQHTEPLALFTDHYVSRFCHLQYKLMQVVSSHHGQCKSSSLSINSQRW